MFLFLLALSGLAWSIVYVDAVRVGLRDRTYAMPLFALGLNLCWEVLNAIVALPGDGRFQGVIDVCWAALDIGILYTYFRYGRRYWPRSVPSWIFFGWTLLVIAASLLLQLLFMHEFGTRTGPAYAAFLQNLLMSVLFIHMFVARRGAEGQSLLIAVAKWIGTLAPTIAFGVLGHSVFLLAIGVLCGVFDLIYIGMMLWPAGRWVAWTSRPDAPAGSSPPRRAGLEGHGAGDARPGCAAAAATVPAPPPPAPPR
ncbi:hypothetical protein SAMN05444858_10758 [Micromonospora avicenniae]|uniref:PQ loop repeat-containing protein n=1 Tax=Micromonospora avicenniae TaxID=1198245 RepID=A0A1N6YWL8_9ACTN|nr:hypothetical protein SAMN05444858_10758 [Micromonospora avicenniae]